jgi:hypothetical protein
MPFYVENVFEELDAPGEWFLDSREGKLYYMPEPGVDFFLYVLRQFLQTNDCPAARWIV